MPAIIDSAPDCIVNIERCEARGRLRRLHPAGGVREVRGHHDVRPRHHLRRGWRGAANGAYYVLTWIGIVVMVAVIVYWVIWENRRLMNFVNRARG